MRTIAFIDAANLFYGGEKSLGWSVDYEKLYAYLKEKYCVDEVLYFAGIETHHFPFDYMAYNSVPLPVLERHFSRQLDRRIVPLTDVERANIEKYLKRVRFYLKLEEFGYQLILKPVKTFQGPRGLVRKANCDVDMAFRLMRDRSTYERVLVLSGDGDFLPVLKFLRDEENKEVCVLAHSSRTAKEIRQFASEKFLDFAYLRERIRFTKP